MESMPEKDCTKRCRSSAHAQQILECVPMATPTQLRTYAVWLCHNFAVVSDKFGRNILHVASSCGKWEIVEWLLKQCSAEIDLKDFESGWTALHRSLFYGQLASARILCMNGGSLRMTDHEGFTPLDIITKDRLPYIEYLPTDPSDVYAWGSNFNYNLGLGNSQSRSAPEILEVFRKDFIDIKQVEICKFHSVFLSTNGKVYTCGFGHGGRLGQETEDITLVPSLVKGLGSQPCTEVAAGQDHLLFLLENGQIWSCGLNVYHQLGLIPPVESILSPKPISLKFLKGKAVTGICAARFHSVIYTKDCVYTFGLNAGQLGHPKGDRTQIHPRQVSALYTEECHLTHVETSDGAIVCATSRGDVYVLHEYQIRKIASRQLEISTLSVVGGHLDSRCDVAGVHEGGGLELRVALLTKSGKLYLWRQTDPYLRRCVFTAPKEFIIADVHINHYSVGIITSNNEGYLGNIVPFKGKRSAPPPTTLHTPTLFNARTSCGLTALIDTDDCHFIKVKKLPNIYRGTSITSDSKGRNFAVLQSNPKMGLIEIPSVSESRMSQDFSRLLQESHTQDDFHDIVIKVEKKEFAAHKFILASRSDYFKKQFSKDNFNTRQMSLESTKAGAFEQVLKFIYTNHCDFLTSGHEVKWGLEKENSKKSKSSNTVSKASNPIKVVQELSRKLSMVRLAKRLEGVRLINGKIFTQDLDCMPRLTFNRRALPNMSDVNLLSSDGSIFGCHKCILVARLDYFHSMLNTCWAENSHLGNLSLPISSKLMEVLVDYLYTEEATKLLDSDDVEYLCNLLMISDQLLIPRLKEMCEMSLLKLVSLKNAAELLELSSVYNSLQLKRSCMQFICINLAAIIESKILDVLSDDVMEELSSYYRSLVSSMHRRKLSLCKSEIQGKLETLEKQFPVNSSCHFEKNKLDYHEGKAKNRRRCNSSLSESKEIPTEVKNENNAEKSRTSIVLDIITPDIEEKESDADLVKRKLTSKQHGQRIMKCIQKEQVISLNKIMLEQKLKLTPLQKKIGFPDMKPIPHLSQKQKKMMDSMKIQSDEIPIPNSPPNKSSCPWAKQPEPSPPSPSFWEAVAKKDFQPSSLSRESSTPVKSLSDMDFKKMAIGNSPTTDHTNDIVISLHDIQRDEEKKLLKTINPKIKPLHILNIEDQAIEELSALYNAEDNHKERITISRVQPEEIASPVWKRGGH